MAEYKISEIVSMDLCEWSLLPSLYSSEATTSARKQSPGLVGNGWHQYDCNVIL